MVYSLLGKIVLEAKPLFLVENCGQIFRALGKGVSHLFKAEIKLGIMGIYIAENEGVGVIILKVGVFVLRC